MDIKHSNYVSDSTRNGGHPTCHRDNWGEIWQYDGGILGGSWVDECDTAIQLCWHRIAIGDSAWRGARTDGLDGDDSIGADGMRGDGVGVGDIIEVYEWTSKSRDFACVFIDGWRKIGNPEPSVVC